MKFIAMVWPAFLARHRPGFDQREAGLHEHDQEAGDQRPHEVDREHVFADAIGNFKDCRRPGVAAVMLPTPPAFAPVESGAGGGGVAGAASAAAGAAVSCAIDQLLWARPTVNTASIATSGSQRFSRFGSFSFRIAHISHTRRIKLARHPAEQITKDAVTQPAPLTGRFPFQTQIPPSTGSYSQALAVIRTPRTRPNPRVNEMQYQLAAESGTPSAETPRPGDQPDRQRCMQVLC